MRKIVLMYHCVYRNNFAESGFQEGNSWQYKVQVDDFEAQVKAISDYCEKTKLSKDCVEFTFDDGGVSFLTVIAPILEKYNFYGIFYISTQYIDTIGFLSKMQIKELYDRGHIIGSHSHSHPQFLSKMKYEEIFQEWRESKLILENIIQGKVLFASIPNGNGSKIVYEAALNNGFKVLDTSIPTTKEDSYGSMLVRGRFVIHNRTLLGEVLKIVLSEQKRKKIYYKWRILSMVKLLLGSNYERLKELILKNLC